MEKEFLAHIRRVTVILMRLHSSGSVIHLSKNHNLKGNINGTSK